MDDRSLGHFRYPLTPSGSANATLWRLLVERIRSSFSHRVPGFRSKTQPYRRCLIGEVKLTRNGERHWSFLFGVRHLSTSVGCRGGSWSAYLACRMAFYGRPINKLVFRPSRISLVPIQRACVENLDEEAGLRCAQQSSVLRPCYHEPKTKAKGDTSRNVCSHSISLSRGSF